MVRFGLLVLLSIVQARPAPVSPQYCAVPAAGAPSLPARLTDGMGKIDFPITTNSAEAQAFFNQGVAQLYGFWFSEAERSFLQAAKLDPQAPMPQWGIAMSAAGDFVPSYQLTGNRSLRGRRPQANTPIARAFAASDAAVKLRSRGSRREQMFIDAIAARRNLNATDPDSDYIWKMKELVTAFPNDVEARVILALALQWGYEPVTKEPAQGSLEAISILKAILAADSDHPGAHHFVIHSVEGGPAARDSWNSCERYPQLAPKIPHAVHMPGHVYVQTGRFDDAIKAFEAAAVQELAYMKADALYSNGHYLHNHEFLIYALGAQGRYQEARKRIDELLATPENPRQREAVIGFSAYRIGWFSLLRTLVRFEKWDEILDSKTFPMYERPIQKSWYHWAHGLAHASKGNAASAQQSMRLMRTSLEELRAALGGIPAPLQIAVAELEGYILARTGQPDKGLEMLFNAANVFERFPYSEPPIYPRPVHELIGKTALQLGKVEQSERAYRRLLQIEPANGRALWGIESYEEFEKAWKSADPEEIRRLRQ